MCCLFSTFMTYSTSSCHFGKLSNFLIHGICVYVCMLVYNLIPNWYLEIKSLIILKISVCSSFHTEFVLFLKIYFHRELMWPHTTVWSLRYNAFLFFSRMQGITGSWKHSIQFNLFHFPKNPLQNVNHMDIEIVKEYIYIYKVIQIYIQLSKIMLLTAVRLHSTVGSLT